MAIGAPTIATNVFGIAEMIEDGVSGVLFPIGDVPALAAAICRLAQNPGEAAALGKAGRDRAEYLLAPAPVAAATVDFYHDILANAVNRN